MPSTRDPLSLTRRLASLLALCVAAATVQAQPSPPAAVPVPEPTSWTLADEVWDRPRSADAIRLLPAVRAAVSALAGTPRASLVIRHGRGQNEGLRAEELRHWLIALAVEPERIAIAPAVAASIEGLPRGAMVLELAR
jgi:hypothetical protein